MGDESIQVAKESTRGSFFLTLGGLASTIIAAIGVFLITGLLGPDRYGVYTISFTVPSIFLTLINLGINQGLTKYSASLHAKKEGKKVATLIHHGIIFNTIIGLVFFILCFILSDLFSNLFATEFISGPEYSGYIRLASTIIFFQTLANTANAILVGFYRTEYSALSSVVSSLIKISIAPLLIVVGLGVVGALIGLVASYLVAATLGILIVEIKIYRSLDKSGVSDSFSANIKMLLKYGFPLFAATIIVGFYTQFQSIILAIFTSEREVGFFKAAQNFATFIRIISVSVATAIFPAFARLNNESKQLKSFFSFCVKYSSLVLLPVVLLLMTFSNEIVTIVYGAAYASTPSYLILITLEFLFVGMGLIVLGSFFTGIGETKVVFKTSLVNFAVFMPAALLLTQSYAVYGLMFAYLAGSFVSTAYGAFVAKRRFGAAPDWRVTARIYVASLVSLLPLFALQVALPLNIYLRICVGTFVFVLLYLTLLPVLRIVSSQELTELERAVARTKGLALIGKVFFFYERIILGWLEKKQ
ncbi:oligosaccharide flippase family protein [Candidatus Bathyarchaeota archaeon]|nr:oligosaccharide flippase family protein [Candidatus Bathyarchaeota archaeon]